MAIDPADLGEEGLQVLQRYCAHFEKAFKVCYVVWTLHTEFLRAD